MHVILASTTKSSKESVAVNPDVGVGSEFKSYTKDLEGLVRAFNERMHAGGRPEFTFSESYSDLPKVPGRDLYQESFLLIQGGQVRGGYHLRHQKFAIRGILQHIACGPQMPLSEGIIDRKYGGAGVLLLRHALRQQPLLFALGIGGMEEAFAKGLRYMGWTMCLVPFYFKVRNPARFLEDISYLRRGRIRPRILDLLRHTGVGWAAARIVHFRFGGDDPSVRTGKVIEFEAWADVLWEKCRDRYSFIGVRDSDTLGLLYPSGDSRFLRLRVCRDRETIGWAVVLDTQMSGHKYFGNMRVGSIVDCLALPEDSAAVTLAATRFLEDRQVDLIVSNQASSAWCRALASIGFLKGPSNFVLAVSKPLAQKLQPWDTLRHGFHMNRGDGDGPTNL